ncbi:MAG: 50S ribosome-binding GTPase [Candidatus Riflebacteria bacterium]|nr:50S ribosome-binding GTPase [Candidatus Riflebacteria bacterium]
MTCPPVLPSIQAGPAADFVALAEDLATWVEQALCQILSTQGAFADLNISGFELGLTLLRGRLIPAVCANLDGPLVAVFWGGTNTGKSTLINSLVGEEVSPAGTTAGFTRHLIGGAGSPSDWDKSLQYHPSWKTRPVSDLVQDALPSQTIFVGADSAKPSAHSLSTGLPLLLDTPDLDSSNPHCREQARLALELADVVVWVTTAQKYKDKAGILFLNEAMTLIMRRLDIFNQALPRHNEAMEDLRRDYDERWPDNDRTFLCIEETLPAQNCLLPETTVAALRERLKASAAETRSLRARSGRFALGKSGQRLIQSANSLRERRRICNKLSRRFRERFESTLFSHLRALPGHEAPFELQETVLRVVGPRMQSRIGDILNHGVGLASRAYDWASEHLLGFSANSSKNSTSPILLRDRQDREAARAYLEDARADLLQQSRKRSNLGGVSFARRFHEELKRLNLPKGDDLEKRLEAHLEDRRRELLIPLITRFENDLDAFCCANPELMTAMKIVVPGFSALAALAAAVVSVHSFALLPGTSEYLLAGIALPIYRSIEGKLPHNLIGWADRLSREPFIQKCREDFVKTRRAIFLETADWIVTPVENLLRLPDLREFDVAERLCDLERRWSALFIE